MGGNIYKKEVVVVVVYYYLPHLLLVLNKTIFVQGRCFTRSSTWRFFLFEMLQENVDTTTTTTTSTSILSLKDGADWCCRQRHRVFKVWVLPDIHVARVLGGSLCRWWGNASDFAHIQRDGENVQVEQVWHEPLRRASRVDDVLRFSAGKSWGREIDWYLGQKATVRYLQFCYFCVWPGVRLCAIVLVLGNVPFHHGVGRRGQHPLRNGYPGRNLPVTIHC